MESDEVVEPSGNKPEESQYDIVDILPPFCKYFILECEISVSRNENSEENITYKSVSTRENILNIFYVIFTICLQIDEGRQVKRYSHELLLLALILFETIKLV